ALLVRRGGGKDVGVNAVSDRPDTLVAGIMEHIERAGVHAGDSYAVYPAQNLLPAERSEIIALTRRIAEAIGVRGLLNIQFIVTNGAGGNLGGEAPQTRVWVLEVNPRASRTVPFLTKVTGGPLTRRAGAVGLGRTLAAAGEARSNGEWRAAHLVALTA